jgi:DNA polymerase III alpha subunit (gram-positive type)
MLHRLHNANILNINELNQRLQSENLYKRQFGSYAIAYARNQRSIKDIYRLVSRSSTQDLHRVPRVFREFLDT